MSESRHISFFVFHFSLRTLNSCQYGSLLSHESSLITCIYYLMSRNSKNNYGFLPLARAKKILSRAPQPELFFFALPCTAVETMQNIRSKNLTLVLTSYSRGSSQVIAKATRFIEAFIRDGCSCWNFLASEFAQNS